jgi:hypothetical protein
MEKKDLLNPTVEKALIYLNFINRVKKIATKFNNEDENFIYDKNDVLKICSRKSIPVTESERGQFFSEYQKANHADFRFGFTIRYNRIDFEFSVKDDELGVYSGGSWALLIQLMTNFSETINLPGFSNQSELEELINSALNLHEIIKEEIEKELYQ